MKYCTKNPDRRRCYLCPLARVCQNASLEVPIKTPSPGERELISDFPAQYSERLGIDWHCLEYKLGKRKADLVFHVLTCEWWIVEAETELNYQAIGQAVVYRSLFKNRKGKEPKALIICRRAPPELVEACRIDADMEVIVLS